MRELWAVSARAPNTPAFSSTGLPFGLLVGETLRGSTKGLGSWVGLEPSLYHCLKAGMRSGYCEIDSLVGSSPQSLLPWVGSSFWFSGWWSLYVWEGGLEGVLEKVSYFYMRRLVEC